MSKYRVQIMVGVDVEADSDGEAISEAIQKVRGIVGDDPTEPMPKEAWVFYIFAAGLGFTWLATVPPTAALVGKLFGARYLATLFGLTLLSHQIGGFLGAWLGGLAIANYGDLTLMWYADIALAVFAALVNLPIKEAPISPVVHATS